jgi:hypothetical protein
MASQRTVVLFSAKLKGCLMGKQFQPRVEHADRAGSGIVITFSDGKCALFPAVLLYAALPHAQEISELKDDED